MSDRTLNTLLDELEYNGIIEKDGKFIVAQNADGLDTEDRLEKLKKALNEISNS